MTKSVCSLISGPAGALEDAHSHLLQLMQEVGGPVSKLTPGQVLLVARAGSFMYGLSTPDSDVDYVVVYRDHTEVLLPLSLLLSLSLSPSPLSLSLSPSPPSLSLSPCLCLSVSVSLSLSVSVSVSVSLPVSVPLCLCLSVCLSLSLSLSLPVSVPLCLSVSLSLCLPLPPTPLSVSSSVILCCFVRLCLSLFPLHALSVLSLFQSVLSTCFQPVEFSVSVYTQHML